MPIQPGSTAYMAAAKAMPTTSGATLLTNRIMLALPRSRLAPCVLSPISLHLFLVRRAQQSRRPHQQYQNQECEDINVTIIRGDIERSELFHKRDHKSAQYSTAHIAD